MSWINIPSDILCPKQLTVKMIKSKKERKSKKTKVISLKSYGKPGTEQNWGVLTLRPPRQLLDPGTPRTQHHWQALCPQPVECWYPVAMLPHLNISGHHLFQSTLIHLFSFTSVCHLAPDLTNPGKNLPRLRSALSQSWQSSMGSASGDVGSAVTDARAGTTTQTLPAGTEFVLCSGTTGTVPLQRERMLK